MAKAKSIFECEACGYQCGKWLGKCPNCGAFESIVELSAAQIKSLEQIKSHITNTKEIAQSIIDIKLESISRISTSDSELDIVLGGGLVAG